MRPRVLWEIDLDAEPLTLFVQHGHVGVVLDADSARIEFQALLFEPRSTPVPPGRRVILWPGDRQVVGGVRHLRVDNDDTTMAIISVSRLQAGLPSVSVESQ